jgi:hypothetical protein
MREITYILLGFGFLSNIASILGAWIGYASAPIGVQSQTLRILWVVGAISSALIYLFAGWLVFQHARKPESTSSEQIASLQAAERRILDLERKLEERVTAEQSALPMLRPRIVPVKFGKTPMNQFGLFIRNHGEPAFDISVQEPVLIGTAKLKFWDRTFSGLTKDDGELFIDSEITLASGLGLTASALRDQMIKADLGTLTLKILYRDFDNARWVTSFDVVREFWDHGLRISSIKQERL